MSPRLSGEIPGGTREIAAHFPAPDEIVGELFVLSQAETATLEDLSETLAKRPLIAARLVRLAGSSIWGDGRQTAGLARAVQDLGGGSVPYVALVVEVSASILRDAPGSCLDMEALRRRAWIRAVTAQNAARMSDAPFAAEVHACGFLTEVGRVALARSHPEHYADLVVAAGGGLPSLAREREAFGFDHIAVNAALFQAWRIPSYIELVHRLSAEPNEEKAEEEELAPVVKTLQLAELTVALFEGEDKGGALTRIEERAADCGIPADMLYELVSNLEDKVSEVSAMLHPDVANRSVWHGAPGRLGRKEQRAVRDAPCPPELEHRRMLPEDPRFRDGLCETPNRKAFELFLDREIQARLGGLVSRPLCVLVLCVEGLAQKHRDEGAQAANEWLREASKNLSVRVRHGDLFARLGGSYFGVCLSEADPHAMESLAERLVAGVSSAVRTEEDLAHAISIGGAFLVRARMPDDGRHLLRSAVRQLKLALEERGGGVRISHGPIHTGRVA